MTIMNCLVEKRTAIESHIYQLTSVLWKESNTNLSNLLSTFFYVMLSDLLTMICLVIRFSILHFKFRTFKHQLSVQKLTNIGL